MASTNDGGKKQHLLDDDEAAEDKVNGTMQTIAGVMGNVLEWYDFALFGFFSDVIATVFFAPSEDDGNTDDGAVDMSGEIDTSNLVRSFAVYGGTFVAEGIKAIPENLRTFLDLSELILHITFSIPTGAFLMRPVGGLAIGYIGDKYGRKQALVIVSLMHNTIVSIMLL